MFYYARFGELFAFDPKAWEETGHSLAAVPALWLLITAGPSAWGLPARGDAFWRASAAVFGSAAVLCAAQVLGVAVCRLLRWRADDWREGLLYQTGAGLGVLAYISLGLAVLGLYDSITIGFLITAILLGGGLWLYFYPVHFHWQNSETSFRSALDARSHAGDWAWKAIALAAFLIALVGALAPEKLLHFACLPLTGLLAYQLTLRFFPRASPWLAVAFFVTIPTVLWEATTAYNDLALTLHSGLTVYALLRYVEDRRRQWLLLGRIADACDP
jgi:hypothetical protein